MKISKLKTENRIGQDVSALVMIMKTGVILSVLILPVARLHSNKRYFKMKLNVHQDGIVKQKARLLPSVRKCRLGSREIIIFYITLHVGHFVKATRGTGFYGVHLLILYNSNMYMIFIRNISLVIACIVICSPELLLY